MSMEVDMLVRPDLAERMSAFGARGFHSAIDAARLKAREIIDQFAERYLRSSRTGDSFPTED